MPSPGVSHRGLSDAVKTFDKMNQRRAEASPDSDAEAPQPFSDLLAARQLTLLDSETGSMQSLSGDALAKLGESAIDVNDNTVQAAPGFAVAAFFMQPDYSDMASGAAEFSNANSLNGVAARALALQVPTAPEASAEDGFLDFDAPAELNDSGSDGLRSAFSELTSVRSIANGDNKVLPQFQVQEHAFKDPNWDKAMSARIAWMSNQGVHSAELRLNPQELGSIKIKLDIEGDQANIHFQAEHSDTRELIERLIPRLQSALESQGIKLDDVKVTESRQSMAGEFSFRQDQQANHQGSSQPAHRLEPTLKPDAAPLQTSEISVRQAVDYYA